MRGCRTNLFERVSLKIRHAPFPSRFKKVHEVVRDALTLLCGCFVRDDVEASVALHRVVVDDLSRARRLPGARGERMRYFDTQLGLANACRAYDGDERRLVGPVRG